MIKVYRRERNRTRKTMYTIQKAKQNVNQAYQYAVRWGVNSRSKCEICGDNWYTVAHHDDYNYPLHVKFLCWSCHGGWHRKNKAIPPSGVTLILTPLQLFAHGLDQLGLPPVKIGNCIICSVQFIDTGLGYCNKCCTRELKRFPPKRTYCCYPIADSFYT